MFIHHYLQKKVDLANLKSDVDKLDIAELKIVDLDNLEFKVNKIDAMPKNKRGQS